MSLPRMTRCPAGALLWVLGHLGACGYDVHDAGESIQTDFPVLVASQRAVVGGANAVGAAAFGSIVGAALYRDSLLAIADGHSEEVHLFSLDGDHLRTLAGEGVGPGLARAIRFISFTSDGGICAWDRQLGRITRFGGTGGVVQTWSPSYDGFSVITTGLLGVVDNCAVAVFRDRIRPELDVGTGDRGLVQTVDTVVHTAVEQQGQVRELSRRSAPPTWVLRSDRLNSHHEVVLGERLESAMVGTILWLGTSDSLRWQRVDLGGSWLTSVRLPTYRRPVTAQDVEQERARRKDQAHPPVVRFLSAEDARRFLAAMDRGREEVPASELLPAYDVMIGGEDRTLWVREASSYSAVTDNWLLLSADGRPLGRLSLPKGGEVVAASSRVLVMRHSDELDAQYLRILEIHGGAARADAATQTGDS